MEIIRKQYVLDDSQKQIAVLIDIEEFEKLEQLVENYALGKFIEDNDPADNMSLEEAHKAYIRMKNTM